MPENLSVSRLLWTTSAVSAGGSLSVGAVADETVRQTSTEVSISMSLAVRFWNLSLTHSNVCRKWHVSSGTIKGFNKFLNLTFHQLKNKGADAPLFVVVQLVFVV